MSEYNTDAYWFPVEGMPRKLEARLTLDYESTSGKRAKRDVDVSAFYRGDGGCIIDCFCHLRNAKRTLSSKSILRAIDRDTGEVVNDIYTFLEAKYNENPEKAYDTILQTYAWTIFILLYVAAADGAIRAPERQLVVDFCMRRGNPAELTVEKLDALVKGLGRPAKSDFQRYIRERTTTPEVIRDIFETAKAIVATNSKVHTEQERALAYMTKQWKQFLVD